MKIGNHFKVFNVATTLNPHFGGPEKVDVPHFLGNAAKQWLT